MSNLEIAERLEAWIDAHVPSVLWQSDHEIHAIIAALRSPSPAQGMYSVEDIEGWRGYVDALCDAGRAFVSLRDPIHGIAAWKSKQPPSTNDVPIETKLVVTPESLRAMASWFDNPNTCKEAVEVFMRHLPSPYYGAGYLLRQIADALAKQLEAGGK